MCPRQIEKGGRVKMVSIFHWDWKLDVSLPSRWDKEVFCTRWCLDWYEERWPGSRGHTPTICTWPSTAPVSWRTGIWIATGICYHVKPWHWCGICRYFMCRGYEQGSSEPNMFPSSRSCLVTMVQTFETPRSDQKFFGMLGTWNVCDLAELDVPADIRLLTYKTSHDTKWLKQ